MSTVTTIILISVSVLLIAWDVYVAANREPGDTISEVLLAAGRRVAGLPFAFGVLAAHLFLPHAFENMIEMPWAAIVLGTVFIVVTVGGMLVRRAWPRFPVTWPSLILGIVAGVALWPQS